MTKNDKTFYHKYTLKSTAEKNKTTNNLIYSGLYSKMAIFCVVLDK